MKHPIIVSLAAIIALTLAPVMINMAMAQQMKCGERAKIVAMLDKQYKETSAGIGLAATGELVELFVSDAGTFTVLISTPQGISCIASIGNGWEHKARGKPI